MRAGAGEAAYAKIAGAVVFVAHWTRTRHFVVAWGSFRSPAPLRLVEDTKGKGHKDHAVNDDDLLLALIPVPDGVTIERLMDSEPGKKIGGGAIGSRC